MSLDFALTDEQEEFRRVVRDFAEEVIAPAADDFNARGELPVAIVRRMGELGLFGIPFPERYGGMGGDLVTFCLAVEEIGRVDQSLGVTLEAAVGLGAGPIFAFGSEEQRQRFLPGLLRGEELAAFGLTEAGGGSDVLGAVRTRAERDGDAWVLNGAKSFITNAGTELTTLCILAARTDDDALTAIVVPVDTPGFKVGPPYRKVGWHASDTREVLLDDVRVPVANTLGSAGEGLRQMLTVLDDGRVALAALATGLIQGCVDECVAHACQREAFGHPIGGYQAVAFPIVDMEVAARTARQSYLLAAWRRDQGLPFKTHASVAKLYASEQAVRAARRAAQVFGGAGFMTESRVGRFYQDAKILEIGEGTSEVQRLVIARALGLPVG